LPPTVWGVCRFGRFARSGKPIGASWKKLVAEASADSDALAALGATSAEDGLAAFGLHACPKAVGRDSLAAVWLKCALRHWSALLFLC